MSVKNRIQAIPQVAFDTATLTGNYQLVTTLPEPCCMIRFINTSTVDIIIAYDVIVGTNGTGYDTIRAGSDFTLNFQANSQPINNMALLPIGTTILVKQRTAAAAGSFSVVGYYQAQGV